MAGRGRPPVGERIAVRLPAPMLASIDARARATGTSRAAVVRALLAEAMGSTDRRGVDLAQVRAQLARTPIERLRHNTAAVNRIRRLRGAARR